MNQSDIEALAKVIEAKLTIFQDQNDAKFKTLFDLLNNKLVPAADDVAWLKRIGGVCITILLFVVAEMIKRWMQ